LMDYLSHDLIREQVERPQLIQLLKTYSITTDRDKFLVENAKWKEWISKYINDYEKIKEMLEEIPQDNIEKYYSLTKGTTAPQKIISIFSASGYTIPYTQHVTLEGECPGDEVYLFMRGPHLDEETRLDDYRQKIIKGMKNTFTREKVINQRWHYLWDAAPFGVFLEEINKLQLYHPVKVEIFVSREPSPSSEFKPGDRGISYESIKIHLTKPI
jgi:hypothetical protein